MALAHFYILQNHDNTARLLFLSRLVEKLYHKALTLCLFIDDPAELANIDQALWDADPVSFLPHGSYSTSRPLPISLVSSLPEKPIADVIIHMSTVPPVIQNYQYFIEVVLDNPSALTVARAHYRALTQQGIAIRTHKITAPKLNQIE